MAKRTIHLQLSIAAIVAAVALPVMTLVPFGWLWLWQNGYLSVWLIAVFVLSGAVFALRGFILARVSRLAGGGNQADDHHDGAGVSGDGSAAAGDGGAGAAARAGRSKREVAALADVERAAAEADPDTIRDRADLLALGTATVERVARHFHPDDDEPIWNFTVPEALALVEQVSARLRPLVVDNVPLGDQLTVGQVLRIYRWRGVVELGQRAYDIWRVVRLANPLAAATQEVRERLSKAVYDSVRQELAQRLLAAYVREVGTAAVDLYSGRLRVSEQDWRAAHPQTETSDLRADAAKSGPLRFLLVGQVGAGKSSLINAMAGELKAAVDVGATTPSFTAHEVRHEGLPEVVLIDSPGLTTVDASAATGDRPDRRRALADQAETADLIIWVVAAHRADRAADRTSLDAVRADFQSHPDRRMPPLVVVVTHVDRLRPFRVWDPPYDIEHPRTPKAEAIRAMLDVVSDDLGVPLDDIVPVSVGPDHPADNVDLVWSRVAARLPEAEGARLLRCLDRRRPGVQWSRVSSQAFRAGRMIARTVASRGRAADEPDRGG